jgi:cobalamin biosynthesis Mg chelatase CobN
MDVFSVLRTGASFNSKKFSKDFKVFERDANKSTGPSESKPKSDLKSLDFFKTSNTNKESSTRDEAPAKKKKRENPKIEATTNTSTSTTTSTTTSTPTSTSTSNSTTESENSSSVNQEELKKKNKIKTRGSDAPPPFHSFEELYERYSIKKYLKNNIAESGYVSPTPIQMQCIPCMLQVLTVILYSLQCSSYE